MYVCNVDALPVLLDSFLSVSTKVGESIFNLHYKYATPTYMCMCLCICANACTCVVCEHVCMHTCICTVLYVCSVYAIPVLFDPLLGNGLMVTASNH